MEMHFIQIKLLNSLLVCVDGIEIVKMQFRLLATSKLAQERSSFAVITLP